MANDVTADLSIHTQSNQGTSSNRVTQGKSTGQKALFWSGRLWFSVTAIGQWIFVVYLFFAYLIPALTGEVSAWNNASPNALIEGDGIGNVAFAFHVLLAIIIIGGGPIQLIPQVRAVVPRFHRWLGRIYMPSIMVTSIAGLYMIWTREIPGGLFGQITISLDAILIFICGALALKYAIQRKIALHREWALRTFMVVSAVWFYRVGLMGWLMLTGGWGVDFETFSGPFLYFLGFAQYLLPLAVLEMYFRSTKSSSATAKYATTATIIVCTLYTAVGIFAASMGMWLPKIS